MKIKIKSNLDDTIEELLDSESDIWGKLPLGVKSQWITPKELLTHKNFVLYGDPRGDYSVEFLENFNGTFEELVKYCFEGGNCDYLTKVFAIVKDGKSVDFTINLTNTK